MKHSPDIHLQISGMGHCPAFKNKKMIARGRLITQPKVRQWMAKATKAMCCQLKCLFQTTDAETSTGAWQQSAIASLPSDDNWKEIPLKVIRVRKVDKGHEGVLITLRKIQN